MPRQRYSDSLESSEDESDDDAEDSGLEDSEDSSDSGKRRKRKPLKRKASQPPRRRAAAKRTAKKVKKGRGKSDSEASYEGSSDVDDDDDDDDEEELVSSGAEEEYVDEDDDDDEEEEEEEEDQDDYQPQRKRASRPTRAAARGANSKIKQTFGCAASDEDELGSCPDPDKSREDAQLARELDREINGLRARPRKVCGASAPLPPLHHAFPPPPTSPHYGGTCHQRPRPPQPPQPPPPQPPAPSPRSRSHATGLHPTPQPPPPPQPPRSRRKPQRASQRSAARGVSYKDPGADWSEESGSEAEVSEEEDSDAPKALGGSGHSRRVQEPIAAFEDPRDSPEEVERVLAHRDVVGVAVDPRCPWSSREVLIKWRLAAYTHCSWEPPAALEPLPGYKRVINYMKKVDQEMAELARGAVSREEQELRDVERVMEEQLVAQHSQVERVVAERGPDDDGDDSGGEGAAGAGQAGTGRVARFLVKWEGLPYSECTWENLEDLLAAQGGQFQLDAFKARELRIAETPHRSVEAQRKQFKLKSTRALETQPDYLSASGLRLRDYQLDGMNWMVYSWSQDRNVILADEMGLGKTVQCVSFIAYLAEAQQIMGPFLVIVPLSVVPNWVREFRRWVPQVNTVVYVGDSRSREVLRAFEFDTNASVSGSRRDAGGAGRKQFEVLITTYELILKDAHVLGSIRWNYMLVDEAHRLKNAESALYQELASWSFANKLLVTGTPLQNSLRELWALLHFLEPDKFPDADYFESAYQVQTMDGVSGLHAALRPHLLRRVIKEVERSLPPKNERILRVEMSPLQKQYYKWILSRNFRELNKGLKAGGSQVSLLNIIGELKKTCNHPFLFESAEESFRGSEQDKSAVDRLVMASGKMVLLDKLLKRLKQTGHRVLIFSQMVRVLDIISDYMRLRGFQHQRLDGSTPAAARHTAMEHFNSPDSTDFAFLLSTRAGGLGINLATADTVVIFDSDWNPQNDLQAMSRAHRIGQTETVNIYRFVTSGSVEEDILERAKRKMVLNHLVIQRMDTSGRTVLDPQATKSSAKTLFGKDELAAILRFGAEELFKSSGGGAGPGGSSSAPEGAEEGARDEDIDAILERAEVVDCSQVGGEGLAAGSGAGGEGGAGGDLLTSFNVATFKNEEDDAAFWSRLIPVAERPPDSLAGPEPGGDDVLLPRAARLRAAGLGPEGSGGLEGGQEQAGDDRSKRAHHRSQGRRGGSEPGPPVEGAALRIEEWSLDVDQEGLPLLRDPSPNPGAAGGEGSGHDAANGRPPASLRSLSRREAQAFVRGVRRFGRASRIDDVCADVAKSLDDLSSAQRLALWHVLMDACRRAVQMTEADGQDAKDAILDFFGSALKAEELLTHCAHMRLLAKRVEAAAAAATSVSSPSARRPTPSAPGDKAASNQQPGQGQGQVVQAPLTASVALVFQLDPGAALPLPKWGKALNWTAHDDAMLLLGTYAHGLGHWELVAADPHLGLAHKLASVTSPSSALGGQHSGDASQGMHSQEGPHDAAVDRGTGLPKASHIETRVLGLLRKMYQVSKALGKQPGKPAHPSARGLHGRQAGGPSGSNRSHGKGHPPIRPAGARGFRGYKHGQPPCIFEAYEEEEQAPEPAPPPSRPVHEAPHTAANGSHEGGGSQGQPGSGVGARVRPQGIRPLPISIAASAVLASLSSPNQPGARDAKAASQSQDRPTQLAGLPPNTPRDRQAEQGPGGLATQGSANGSANAVPAVKAAGTTAAATTTATDAGSTAAATAAVGPSKRGREGVQHAVAASRSGHECGEAGTDLLAPVMSHIKSWRKLGDDDKLDNATVAKRMIACLKAVGAHIDCVVSNAEGNGGPLSNGKDGGRGDAASRPATSSDRHAHAADRPSASGGGGMDAEALRARLWRQISRATKSDRSGEQLQALYRKVAAREQGGPQLTAPQGPERPRGVVTSPTAEATLPGCRALPRDRLVRVVA
ncbi:SNF2 family N-terminal domain-containing protein [Haematococcus lacustris]